MSPVRIFTALTLAAGLMLGTASISFASPESEETEEADMVERTSIPTQGTDDSNDSSPTPSPTETATSPSPTETATAEPTPTPTETESDHDLNNGDPDGEDGETTSPPPMPPVEVSCNNTRVTAGQTAFVTCSTDPSSATLSVSTVSQIGATIEVSGKQLAYLAPSDTADSTTDDITVIATTPDREDGRTQVTVTVEPATEDVAPPTPTMTSPPATSPPEEETFPMDETGQSLREESATSEQASPPTNVAAPPPGAPTHREHQTPAGSLMLPVPGMPSLPELAILGTGPVNTDTSREPATDQYPEALATSGSYAALSAGVLGGLAIAMGAGALFTSRRLR